MIVLATYRVKIENSPRFLKLLKQCELVMRQEGLITSRAILRIKSQLDKEVIVEIFEWKTAQSFQEAQKNNLVLQQWKAYEELWIEGGFGLNKIPESELPWAKFELIN